MTDQAPRKVTLKHDIVQIEFVIEDLIKQLIKDRLPSVASCSGCKGCRAAADLPSTTGEE